MTTHLPLPLQAQILPSAAAICPVRQCLAITTTPCLLDEPAWKLELCKMVCLLCGGRNRLGKSGVFSLYYHVVSNASYPAYIIIYLVQAV